MKINTTSRKRRRSRSLSTEMDDPEISFRQNETENMGSEDDEDQEVILSPQEPEKKRRRIAVDDEVAIAATTKFGMNEEETENFGLTENSEPRRSPNGYLLPDPLPAGLILTDLTKKQWKLGKSVGLGGFGEIYSAASWNGNNTQSAGDEDYVVKVVSR